MRNSRCNTFGCFVVAVLFLSPFTLAAGGSYPEKHKKQPTQCDPTSATLQCGEHERCLLRNDGQAWCDCVRSYESVDGECVQISATVNATTIKPDFIETSGGGSVAAGLLVPIFLVATGVLLYFGARRYKWLQRFRQFRQNRYGNVLVTRDDDDDDDPPIA